MQGAGCRVQGEGCWVQGVVRVDFTGAGSAELLAVLRIRHTLLHETVGQVACIPFRVQGLGFDA